MTINRFLIAFFLFAAFSSFSLAQENEEFMGPSERPRGTIRISVGETRTVSGTVRRGAPHFYKFAIPAHLKVQVISSAPQTPAFAVHEIQGRSSGPERTSFGGDTEWYPVASSERNYELEKGRDYELAIAAPSKLRQTNYSITIKAVPSVLRAYKFPACGQTTVIRTNLVEINQNNLNNGFMGGRNVDYGGADQENYFFWLKDGIDADLNADGVNEKLILAECSVAFEPEMNYPKTYVLYAFDSRGESVTPISSINLDTNQAEDIYPSGIVFKNDKITVNFLTNAVPEKQKTKTYNYSWSNNKFVKFADKSDSGNQRNAPPLAANNNRVNAGQLNNQTRSIEKGGFEFEVPAAWTAFYERSDAIALALPENVKQINNKPEVSFGIIAGETPVKPNTAKSILNSVIGTPIINTTGLKDASNFLVKETAKQSGYKQIGGFQNTTIAGRPALQAQLNGVSKATGKMETVLIFTVLMGNGKLFYLQAVYPSSAKSVEMDIFEGIRNSVRLL